MADLLKELADVLGIREVKKGVPHAPKKRNSIQPNWKPIEPVPTIVWGDELQATIDADERKNYNKDRFKPVRPRELSDWRHDK